MLTQHYSAQQRRALNQIWNAAGEYGFDPLFLALKQDGSPDLYMNCIVGCVRKWFGEEMPRALFGAWAEDRRQAMLDDLAWLALESAVFQLESPQRPALDELRRDHARDFFGQEYKLSRQEWMAKNQLVYTIQSARWRQVLGRRPPVMTPWEASLSKALDCGGITDGDALAGAIRQAFARAGLFSGTAQIHAPLRLHFDGKWASALTRLMPTEIVHTDVLSAGRSTAAGSGGGKLLDLARVDNGAVKTNSVEVNLSDLIEEEVLPFEPLYFEKGLTLSTAVEKNIHVKGSPQHLRQVLGILLDNAMKYSTPEGEVRVKLIRHGSHCQLSVASPGENISTADLENIFKRFYRVDKARSRDGSYGLGLPIAQSIVQAHKGKIWAQSSEGVNTFFVQLPLNG